MQENIVRMRQVRLIHQTSWGVGDRICEYPVVLETWNVADSISTVMTQPVIQAIAKPGAVVNHIQGSLPQIEALRRGADALHIDMTIQEEGNDARMEDSDDESGNY